MVNQTVYLSTVCQFTAKITTATDTRRETDLNPEYYHLAVVHRGYVSPELANLMHGQFEFCYHERTENISRCSATGR